MSSNSSFCVENIEGLAGHGVVLPAYLIVTLDLQALECFPLFLMRNRRVEMKKYGSLGLEVCDWDFMCNFWLKNGQVLTYLPDLIH